MNERDLPVREYKVGAHSRKRQSVRPPITEQQKFKTAGTYALKGTGSYASALAALLRRWCGDESLAVARELVTILENDQCP